MSKSYSFCFLLLLLFLTNLCTGQQLISRMHKVSGNFDRTKVSTAPLAFAVPAAVAPGPPAAFVAPGAPTITSFQPTATGIGKQVVIIGSNFDQNTRVTFGGTPAASTTVVDANTINAVVGAGQSGPIIVTNATNASASIQGFTLVPPPTITAVAHTKAGTSTTVTITGTNFIGYAEVSVNGQTGSSALILSPTVVMLTLSSSPIITSVVIGTPGGEAEFPSSKDVTGNVDLNLPDFGNGLTLIPTPSFEYNQAYAGNNFAFSEKMWGNTLGVDSSMQRLGAKFLFPQTSVFGLKAEGAIRFSNRGDNVMASGALEVNFLVKKVSHFDTLNKKSTNFNPFVIHPRLGAALSFYTGNVYVGVYSNFLCVVGNQEQFKSFFDTGSKNVFVYPEIDMGGLIGLGNGGNQAIKVELNLLVNNGDAQFMTKSTDAIIPALKIGFVTSL